MKALILVGGFGTRLRPLTLTKPKPIIPFCNEPMVLHQIRALKEVGVDEVVLAINYQPELMMEVLGPYAEKITPSKEDVPMGTAGPLFLAQKILKQDNEPFFVLNADVICQYPFRDLLNFHKNHEKEGTIFVTKVEDPSKYGVVVFDEASGLIDKFVEKPKVFVGNKINAGMYIFNNEILDRIPGEPTSIERVIFPEMARNDELYAMELPGYWMDLGQPKDYLTGAGLHLDAVAKRDVEKKKKYENATTELTYGDHIVGTTLVGDGVVFGANCKIGPNVVIGSGCTIGEGTRLQNTILFENCHVGSHTWCRDVIMADDGRIGDWVRMEGICVIDKGVVIGNEIFVNGARILHNKEIKESIATPQIVM